VKALVCFLLVGMVGGLLAGTAQTPGAGSRAALPADRTLRAHMNEVATLLNRASYKRADRALKAMLENPLLRTEAREASAELLELARRCAFGVSYGQPSVADLLGADSASWNERSGKLQISFTRASVRHESAPRDVTDVASVYAFHPQAFQLSHGVLLLEVPFVGHCQIAVVGTLPEHKNDRKRAPQLMLQVDEQLAYTVDFTWPSTHRKSRGLWSQGTVYAWQAGVSELLATDPTPGGKYNMMWGERYALKFVVKSRSLVASLQGYGMLSVSKQKRAYGRLGFRWCPSIQSVQLSGIVAPEVIDSLREQSREREYANFLETVPAGGLLPDWITSCGGS
jgi:hypothetical protein